MSLPPARIPLNRHSLSALEAWLRSLGAERSPDDFCLWLWQHPSWLAEIRLDIDDVRVSWSVGKKLCQRSFPYGLSRADVEAALLAGP